MDHSKNEPWLNTCRIVCTLAAIIAGLFVAAICSYWLGFHGLLAAIIGLIVALVLAYVLPDLLCDKDLFGLRDRTTAAAAAPAAAPAAAAPAPKPASAAPAAPKAKAAKAAPAKSSTKDEVKATDIKLYSERPDTVDDLKIISGVGPKMEAMVNKIGVYTFEQVASWKKADVDYVDSLLDGFRGRIERDEWVKQAKKLMKK